MSLLIHKPKKGAATEHVASAVVAAVLILSIFVFLTQDAIKALLSWQDLETRQHASTLRTALVFPDEQVTGIKYIEMKNIFSVELTYSEVKVSCINPLGRNLCSKSYVATVKHNVPPDKLYLNNPDEKGSVCVVKKKIFGENKITICSLDEQLEGRKCCSLGE